MSMWYRIASPAVIYERFDDELVAINLNTGVYHSLIGTAADVFQLLSHVASAEEIAQALTVKYSASSSQILDAIAPFLQQLLTEELIIAVEPPKDREPLKFSPDVSGVPLVPPSLEAYRDLQSLFLLDPVHEVSDQGWPQAASRGPDA